MNKNIIPYKVIGNVLLSGDDCYEYRYGITSIAIPMGVERIAGAFAEYVKHIKAAPFCGFKYLTDVDIPYSVKSIGYFAFAGTGLWKLADANSAVYADKWIIGCIGCKNKNGKYADFKGNLKLRPDAIGIADHAFYDRKELTGIEIPIGLKYIGVGAFYNCEKLESILIPKSVTHIGIGYQDFPDYYYGNLPNAGLFYNCSNLESILVENGNPVYKSENNCIIRIADNTVIAGCKNSIIPDYVEEIADFAFWGCNIENITIPKSVTKIGNEAFYDCKNLKSIKVDKGNPVFTGENNCLIREADKTLIFCCQGAKIPDYVINIEKSAFSGVESIVIPKNVIIKYNNFYRNFYHHFRNHNNSLRHLEISHGVEEIGAYAFGFRSGLKSIIIPESVTRIGKMAFHDCSNLEIYVKGHTKKPVGWDKGWKQQTKNVFVYWNYKQGENDAGNAVSRSDGLKYKLINNGTAYETCCAPKDINGSILVPAAYDGKPVLRVGHGTFKNCPLVTDIIISAGITEIGSRAFESNAFSRIKSISIPDTVIAIGLYAFRGCNALEKLEIPDSIKAFGVNLSNEAGIHTVDGGEMFFGCTSLKSVKLPKGLTKLGEKIFSQCHSLISVIMPDNVEEIGAMAFMNCKELIDIKIPDNAIIGDRAFFGCKKLKKK